MLDITAKPALYKYAEYCNAQLMCPSLYKDAKEFSDVSSYAQ
jgi:hypothetical protein